MRLSSPSAACRRTLLRSCDGRGTGQPQCRVAVDIVALTLNVPAGAILSRRRAEARVARARHVAMYLSHVVFQETLASVADAFGRDRTSVGYALARVEDERDDREFDRQLTLMEQLAQSCRRLSAPANDLDDLETGR